MLQTETRGNILVVSLQGTDRLTADLADNVSEGLLTFFQKPDTDLVFDLKGIHYIDSIGFGVFLSALKAANNNYGRFKICNVTEEVMAMFDLLQLHHLFEIYDRLDACLSSFNPK
jgi:anti-anti-sigma factor